MVERKAFFWRFLLAFFGILKKIGVAKFGVFLVIFKKKAFFSLAFFRPFSKKGVFLGCS